jgi:hypothetical protein
MGTKRKRNVHPKGEPENPSFELSKISKNMGLAVDTFRGKVHVEWDPQGAVTSLGQLAFFVEFLKQGDLFDPWVDDFPIEFVSPNAPRKRDILGTILLSVLSGYNRYAHITALRADGINPDLLGMTKVVSEDSMRRGMKSVDEGRGIDWLRKHLSRCYRPLMTEDWILDIDTTVKVLYGKQEGAVVGYNPRKPGRPSHTYHTFMMANVRMILDVEVQPGNQMASSYTSPDLFALLDQTPRACWPQFIRGDSGFGTDGVMTEAETRGVPYLFKLRGSKLVKELILRVSQNNDWECAGWGFDAQEASIKLTGWKESRRVVVMRKKISKESLALSVENEAGQMEIHFAEIKGKMTAYEYSVLITSLPDDVMAIAQHYRDRADCENVFDEMKNQWGWAGFTTSDMKRCRLMAKIIALIYNWWSLFVRLAEPRHHLEAITSRPLLLHAVAKQTSHSGQTRVTITSTHGKRETVERLLARIVGFFEELRATAEQLTGEERWLRILSKAMEYYLKGRLLKPPNFLPAPA